MYEDEFGRKLNSDRRTLGVPIIEEDWILHKRGGTYRFWSNPSNRVVTTEPHHLWKNVYLHDTLVVQEEDVFHFETKSDTAYRLVTKWFPKEALDSTAFRFIIYFRDKFPPTEGKQVNIQFSDSVLVSWGLERFRFGKK